MRPARVLVTSLVVVAVAIASPNHSIAQNPETVLGNLQAQQRQQDALLKELRSAISDIKSENVALAIMIKSVLALQSSNTAAAIAKDAPERAQEAAKNLKERAKVAESTIENIPNTSIPVELKDRIRQCISKSYAAASSGPTDAASGLKILETCPDAQALAQEIAALRQKAVEDWKACKQVLVNAGTLSGTSLPDDPSGLSAKSGQDLAERLKAVETLVSKSSKNLKECGKKLSDVHDQIRDQDKTAGTLGVALQFAAQMCMASGANPYVCGTMLAVAILISLFKGGGGGGGGDGEGDGKGEGEGEGAGSTYQAGTFQGAPSLPGRAPNLTPVSPGGSWGKIYQGSIGCDEVTGRLSCWLIADPATKIVIDPARSVQQSSPVENQLKTALMSRSVDRIDFCLASAGSTPFVRGIILKVDDGRYRPIEIKAEENNTLLNYPAPESKPLINGRNMQTICNESFE